MREGQFSVYESESVRKWKAKGWSVVAGGWPDMMAVAYHKDGRLLTGVPVESKTGSTVSFTRSQFICFRILEAWGVPIIIDDNRLVPPSPIEWISRHGSLNPAWRNERSPGECGSCRNRRALGEDKYCILCEHLKHARTCATRKCKCIIRLAQN